MYVYLYRHVFIFIHVCAPALLSVKDNVEEIKGIVIETNNMMKDLKAGKHKQHTWLSPSGIFDISLTVALIATKFPLGHHGTKLIKMCLWLVNISVPFEDIDQ